MTMHLMHPALSTTGKRRGKQKFRNAAEAKLARELESEWAKKQSEWASISKPIASKVKINKNTGPSIPEGRRTTNHIPSLDTGVTGAVNVRQTPKYTGDAVLGITIVHKSCLQPIFNQQAAVDAANMRR